MESKKKFNFFSMFDKTRFTFVTKIIIIFVVFVVSLKIMNVTYSKYVSSVETNAEADIAFFVIDSGTYEHSISLKGLKPSAIPFTYSFNVYNFKDGDRCEVNMNYTIEFYATTNMPLSFKIYKGNNTSDIVTNRSTVMDGDMYYKKLEVNNTYRMSHTQDQTDSYTLEVEFPFSFRNSSEPYQGLIDYFRIVIHAEQVA